MNNRFHIELDVQSVYSVDAPTLQVLVNGAVIDSFSVAGDLNQIFQLEYPDATSFPASLQFRFTDASGEGGRSVTINSLRINGQLTDTSDLSQLVLSQGQAASFDTSANDHLFGRVEPTLADYGGATESGGILDDIIQATVGVDIIDAGDGDDRVRGVFDDDTIFGGDGNDTIFGESGNDTIVGDAGNDLLFGNAGDDLIFGGADVDTLIGGSGNDVLNGGSGGDYLIGDSGDDILYGEDGDDTLVGMTGDDSLYGDAGNDTLAGGLGDDYMEGGDDDDTLIGESGNDIIYGDGGDDYVFGGAGQDAIYGGDDDDVLYGGADVDTIDGGNGDDYLSGGTGDDALDGGGGNDVLSGGAGTDNLSGGSGNDALHGHGLNESEISIILRENPGVLYSEASHSFYQFVDTGSNLSYSAASAAAQGSVIDGVNGHLATITTSMENDFILANWDGVTSSWIAGTDKGNEGMWSWSEGIEAGLEFYEQGVGAITGLFEDWDPSQPNGNGTAPGQDYMYLLESSDQWADAYDDPWSVNASFVDIQGYIIEWDAGSFSDDNAVDTLNGRNGHDSIYGYGGDDILDGGNGNDVLFGGAGDDDMSGGNGDDILVSGGSQQVNIDLTNETLLSYGGSQDTGAPLSYLDDGVGVELDGNLWKKVLVDYTVTANTVVEFDFRSSVEAEISAIGFDNDNNIDAGASFQVYGTQNWGISTYHNYDGSGDWVHYTIDVGSVYTGTFSHFTIINDDDGGGTDGNGWFRNIVIHEGGGESNTLNGGNGLDQLYGDLGADTFVFDNLNDIDVIHRFNAAEGDVLDISDILSSTSDPITDYVRFTDSGDHVIMAVDANGSAGGSSYTSIAEIRGYQGADVSTFYADGNIIIV